MRHLHRTFPTQICALALEFKKTFMDEWSGELDTVHLTELQLALRNAIPTLLTHLAK